MSEQECDASAIVDAVMRATRREDFLPPLQTRLARFDRPLSIGLGQTCSQPSTVRRMLELLDVRTGQHVLDVGSGSGWTTALLGRLVGPTGRVVGVELEAELASSGGANVASQEIPWARVEMAAAGQLGWPQEAPYDRILVSAEADSVPQELVDQLRDGGVMVLPAAGELLRVRRAGECPTCGSIDTADPSPLVERFGRYRFVPLR